MAAYAFTGAVISNIENVNIVQISLWPTFVWSISQLDVVTHNMNARSNFFHKLAKVDHGTSAASCQMSEVTRTLGHWFSMWLFYIEQ